jgi:N-acetylmuramoyl-L-alanine amidase
MPAFADSTGYVNGVRMWSAPQSSRIVFDTNRSIKHRLFVLHNPERVVVDFFDTRITKSLNALDITNSNIKRVRSAARNKDTVRVVFDMKVAVQPKSFTLSPNNKYGHRLVIDLFEKKKKSNKPVRSVSSSGKLKRLRDVVIAIDAGHGGEDPGARGRSGKYEKDLVLSIARRLEKKIQNQRGMRAVMIRKGDYFVSLNGRKKIARKNKADMFVSIHADSFKNSKARGASVFALSSRGASSEAARILAQNENAADVIGGVYFD